MVWLIVSIAMWGFVHSWMASLGFKNSLQRIFGMGVSRFYRLFYNVFSAISILPILYLMLTLPDVQLYQVPAPWSYVMRMGQGGSALLLLFSLLQTDVLSFAGVRQLFEAEKSGSLITSGIYRAVRHPLYTFGLLTIWLSPTISRNTLIVYVSFTAYILIGIYFEERKLLREFGQAYARYKSVTPMLIPWLKFGGNKSSQ